MMPASAAMMGMAGVDPEMLYEDDETDNSIPDIQKVTKKNNILPIWGNQRTMNMNPIVLENIRESYYYKNVLTECTTYQQLADEVFVHVKHLEPWEKGTRKTQGMTGMCGGVRGVGAGGVVTSAFCLLYRMFEIRLTRRQLVGMINHASSQYLRGMGFLYIRYCQPPTDHWVWFEPYLEEDSEVDPRSGGGEPMMFGQMVRMMITKLDWYGTLFPRIPVPIQKELDARFRELSQYQLQADKEGFNDDRDRDRKRVADRDGRDGSSQPKKPHTTRCAHHLRHHHCRKHRKQCPDKANKARAEKDGVATAEKLNEMELERERREEKEGSGSRGGRDE